MVSFILAVGDWTESPWRAMDEYDVFMDASNRRVSTELLLGFALKNPELQIILLTPQVGGGADRSAGAACMLWGTRLAVALAVALIPTHA
jgi:chromosome segregation ATPase